LGIFIDDKLTWKNHVDKISKKISPGTSALKRLAGSAGSVTQIAFKYKPTGFRIKCFKNDFSVHYFVFVYS